MRLIYVAIFAIALLFAAPSCAKAPPNITPQATAEYYATQAVKILDGVRDAAQIANQTAPPLLSDAALLKVVDWHEALVKTLHAAPGGWKATALTGLDQVQNLLPAADWSRIKPAVDAAKLFLQEIQ